MMEQMGDSAWVHSGYVIDNNLQWDPPVRVAPAASIPRTLCEELNHKAEQAALLDAFANILWVNDAWRQFGARAELLDANYGAGLNYLDVCDRACEQGSFEAGLVARGLREVISGLFNSSYFRYGFEAEGRRHLFAVRITRLLAQGSAKFSVLHERIL